MVVRKSAIISECGRYRYRLDRVWAPGPLCTFVMLNPSTADAQEDDPTIRRCMGFAKREACGGLVVVNLFAFRATNPETLRTVLDPVGRENDYHIALALLETDGPVVGAWGSNAPDWRVRDVGYLFLQSLLCLGVTRNGNPRHPLYIRGDEPLVPWKKMASA